MKNGTVPFLGQAIEIVTSSTSTNYAFVIEVQTSPPGRANGTRPPDREAGDWKGCSRKAAP
jgi:hypothetical protein